MYVPILSDPASFLTAMIASGRVGDKVWKEKNKDQYQYQDKEEDDGAESE